MQFVRQRRYRQQRRFQVGEGRLENTLSGSGSLVKPVPATDIKRGQQLTYFGDTTIAGGCRCCRQRPARWAAAISLTAVR